MYRIGACCVTFFSVATRFDNEYLYTYNHAHLQHVSLKSAGLMDRRALNFGYRILRGYESSKFLKR